MMALTLTFVGETVAKEKFGSAMGLLGTMSAIGTALGPSLGGVLIAGLGWRSIFLVNLPLGIFTFLLARRYLPADFNVRTSLAAGFDYVGTLLLALTLGAFALAMTVGRGNFGTVNLALLALATGSVILFIRVEARTTTPLIQMVMFRRRILTSGLIMSVLVATVMMATLVVGPFYLARALGLETALVGLTMSVGPLVATLSGVPVGRTTDRFGAQRVTIGGLVLMLFGTLAIAAIPTNFGVPGYLAPLVITTVGYMLFQTANNTAIMTKLHADQRGVISGMLSLSRNLGLVMGASLMGTIFAFSSATTDVTSAPPDAVATGMRVTFSIAATLIAIALAIAARVTKKMQR